MNRKANCTKCGVSRDEGVFEEKRAVCRPCRLKYKKEQRQRSFEQRKAYTKKYNAQNRGMVKHCAGLQRARKHGSIPVWADLKLIKDMYDEADHFGLQIDHIIPLNGKNVCGLHWEGNLQALTAEDNYVKGNFYVCEYNKDGLPVIDFSIMGGPLAGAL
jgi:hypothetical protein